MPAEGQAAHKATPAAEALGFMYSWLFHFQLWMELIRNAASPSPVMCHHSNFSLIASQSNLFFPNIKDPQAMLGEAGLPPKPLLHPSALPGGLDTLPVPGTEIVSGGAVGPGQQGWDKMRRKVLPLKIQVRWM